MAIVEEGGAATRLLNTLFGWLRREGIPTLVIDPGAPIDDPDQPMTREQLIVAREQLSRQIEILGMGPARSGDSTPMTPLLIDELQAELAAVEDELASRDGQRVDADAEPAAG